jgi:trimethylamine--corrinoid protein Co-methyltransferase
LAGANLIYGLGMVESGMTFDFAQLVIDNEFAKMIRFVVGGIPVNDETLAVDVTKDVGPFKNFLTHPATVKHMYSQSQTKLINRQVIGRWTAEGSRGMYENALEEARSILENHKPDPLPKDVRQRLRDIVISAEKERGEM